MAERDGQMEQGAGAAVERPVSANPVVNMVADAGRAAGRVAAEELAERKSIDDLISFAQQERDKNKPETAEDVARRMRKERTGRIVAGATDMARALSNLFFTTQYAPNMYSGNNAASKHLREIYDREKAERAAKDDLFFRYAMMAKGLRDGERKRRQDLEDRGRRHAMEDDAAERAEQAAQTAAEQAAFDKELNPIRRDTAMAQRDEAVADAKVAKAKADWVEEHPGTLSGKGGSGGSGGSGGRGGKTWSLRTTDGVLTYNTKEEYYAGIMEWAEKYNLPDTLELRRGGKTYDQLLRFEHFAGLVNAKTDELLSAKAQSPKPVAPKKKKPNPMLLDGEE